MSAPEKPDPDRGGEYLMKLLAEDEADRVEAMSDDEFLAYLKRKGRDRRRVPTAEEWIAKVKAKAALQARKGTGGTGGSTN